MKASFKSLQHYELYTIAYNQVILMFLWILSLGVNQKLRHMINTSFCYEHSHCLWCLSDFVKNVEIFKLPFQ